MDSSTFFYFGAGLLLLCLSLLLYFLRRRAPDHVADIAGRVLATKKFGGGILDGTRSTSRKALATSVVLLAVDWVYADYYGRGFLGAKVAGYLFLFIVVAAIASFGRRT